MAVAVTVRVLKNARQHQYCSCKDQTWQTNDGAGVIVVCRYDEQSAVPGLVGKLEALTAESFQYGDSDCMHRQHSPLKQLSALHLGEGFVLPAAIPTTPKRRMMSVRCMVMAIAMLEQVLRTRG